jgi:hypothetical protein
MIAFLGTEAAYDGQAIGLAGQLGKMLAEAEARHAGRDFLEGPAVGVAGLHIKRVGLRWSACHPQKNATPPAILIIGQRVGEPRKPAAGAHADARCSR